MLIAGKELKFWKHTAVEIKTSLVWQRCMKLVCTDLWVRLMFKKVIIFVQLWDAFSQLFSTGSVYVCFSGSWPSSFSSLDRIKSKQQLLSLLSSTCCIKMNNHFSRLCIFAVLSLFPDMRNTIANIIVVITVIIYTILRCCCSGFCEPA